jgi:RNA polymerase sigma factor (sigma-70 family)
MSSQHESPAPITEFDRSVSRLFSTVQSSDQYHGGESSATPSRDYEVVSRALRRFARGLGVPASDVDDVVSEAIAEALARVSDRDQEQVRKPGAYLFRTTRNRAFDWRRRTQTRDSEVLVENVDDATYSKRYYSNDDDATVRLFDSDATAERLEDALRAADAAGDELLIRVVGEWIDLAEKLGKKPSNRAVGRAIGISHTSVNQVMERLQNYF